LADNNSEQLQRLRGIFGSPFTPPLGYYAVEKQAKTMQNKDFAAKAKKPSNSLESNGLKMEPATGVEPVTS
jgi:hypothetical protein